MTCGKARITADLFDLFDDCFSLAFETKALLGNGQSLFFCSRFRENLEMTSITYPDSRAHAANCKLCISNNGQMRDDGYVSMETDDGRKHRLMKRTCNYCGYTIFFESETARKASYSGGDNEIFSE